MKIRCDFCGKDEASVYCSADEATLCHSCDRHVHHANKLAEQHTRFSLLHPPFKESPLCDICQDRRAFLFCQEDRAILCRECDVPIHLANEHTQKHNRFLLTGVKLSSTSSLYPTCSSSPGYDTSIDSETCRKRSKTVNNGVSSCPSEIFPAGGSQISDAGSFSTSRISEYLETLPGWCIEDFLDPASSIHGHCQIRSRPKMG